RRGGAIDLHGGQSPLILEIRNLDVYYGRAHALQGVSLALDHGVLAVVGRNGMGKTTLCNAVTGLVRASGSVKLAGEEILGLAPIIVQQVVAMLKALTAEGEISVLLIEQNFGVATGVADTVDVMVNGRIARSMTAAELAADRELQQRLLGVKMDSDLSTDDPAEVEAPQPAQILTVRRASDSVVAEPPARREERTIRGFTRWSSTHRDHGVGAEEPRETRAPEPRVVELPVAQTMDRAAYIAGTFDTKGRELFYLRGCLEKLGLRTVTVDLATSGK